MKIIYPIAADQVAKKLGTTRSSVNRHATRLGVGRYVGRVRIFSESDVSRLAGEIREKPGCPLFVAGNDLGGRRKKSPKKQKK
jgi:hypothetical protein